MKIIILLKLITPPFLRLIYQRVRRYKPQSKVVNISGGILNGKNFILDPLLHPDMANGSYDDFFWNYLSKIDMKDKDVYEIGAHIGFHTLCFSALVGSKGKVISFEPNPFNRARLMQNLSLNSNLKERVKLIDKAVSNITGKINFNFSSNVDDGSSSGSFISGAHVPSSQELYENIGFQNMDVETTTIDDFFVAEKSDCPSIIKIDVEGAENFVLEGALKLISLKKTVFLIEIHSIFNMYFLFDFFSDKNYSILLLKEEADGRCFVVCEPKLS